MPFTMGFSHMPVTVTRYIRYLQIADSLGPSTVVVKIVKVSPATAPCRSPDSQHTVSIVDPTSEAKVSFSAVYQPCNLLERPKVCLQTQAVTFCLMPIASPKSALIMLVGTLWFTCL